MLKGSLIAFLVLALVCIGINPAGAVTVSSIVKGLTNEAESVSKPNIRINLPNEVTFEVEESHSEDFRKESAFRLHQVMTEFFRNLNNVIVEKLSNQFVNGKFRVNYKSSEQTHVGDKIHHNAQWGNPFHVSLSTSGGQMFDNQALFSASFTLNKVFEIAFSEVKINPPTVRQGKSDNSLTDIVRNTAESWFESVIG
ncbi:hypothetical protein CROQUDRAFT_133861 [Cronartium quercuum f. sp. fusiforme G11]|uniref:Secreted protein n=1 Tax=Cronartium quercuum f. sp. fusiforme G11 TaxID=708437 RepID=A0A9P6TAI6_9BASI|nr:hypothetical protein CROQUDRAFT_133861 [Cronartium quercuum f. sp. fusiforme G11]